jgi:hypothetical protein
MTGQGGKEPMTPDLGKSRCLACGQRIFSRELLHYIPSAPLTDWATYALDNMDTGYPIDNVDSYCDCEGCRATALPIELSTDAIRQRIGQ